MLKAKAISPVVRAVLVMGAVAALVTGVTFAALESGATLTQMSIESTGALQVNNDPNDTTFTQSETGFAFEGIVPGVASSQEEQFQLRNISTTDVDVNVQIPSAPVLPAGVTGDDIVFTFDPITPDAAAFTATWAELTTGDGKAFAADLLGDTDDPADGEGETRTYSVKVDIDGSVTSDTVTIPNFDLLFGVPTL